MRGKNPTDNKSFLKPSPSPPLPPRQVSLPGAETYLVDVTDDELREYILQAAAFEASQVQATTLPPQSQSLSQTQSLSQSQFSSQTQTQPQTQAQGSTSGTGSTSQTSSSSTNQTPPVRGAPSSAGYNYPQPSIPFGFSQR